MDECGICKEDVDLSIIIKCNTCSLECCKSCMDEWIKRSCKCPQCRTDKSFDTLEYVEDVEDEEEEEEEEGVYPEIRSRINERRRGGRVTFELEHGVAHNGYGRANHLNEVVIVEEDEYEEEEEEDIPPLRPGLLAAYLGSAYYRSDAGRAGFRRQAQDFADAMTAIFMEAVIPVLINHSQPDPEPSLIRERIVGTYNTPIVVEPRTVGITGTEAQDLSNWFINKHRWKVSYTRTGRTERLAQYVARYMLSLEEWNRNFNLSNKFLFVEEKNTNRYKKQLRKRLNKKNKPFKVKHIYKLIRIK